jgi:hypothetical protein
MYLLSNNFNIHENKLHVSEMKSFQLCTKNKETVGQDHAENLWES